jgi:acyl dehydratase
VNAMAGVAGVGDELPPLTKGPVTRQHLVEWCAAENDYFALHYDERVAERMKIDGTPIQGTYRYALMGQVVSRWMGASGRLRRISAGYRALAMEGETLTARARVTAVEPLSHADLVHLDVWVEAGEGRKVAEGTAEVELARPA